MVTGESFYSTMDFNMFIKVSLLGEAEFTVIMWALVWSFIGMDPQVVEEIVPFSESFSA